MTVQEIIIEALRKIGVTDPGTREIIPALTTFNNLADNFLFWIEHDCPALPLALDDVSPFKPHYNEALIVKLAIKESVPHSALPQTVQSLMIEDKDNMARLDYQNALNRGAKSGMVVT